MSSQIQLVRHGAYSGEHLTLEGEAQAKFAAKRLKSIGFNDESLVLTSDKSRAVQTGEIIAEFIDAQPLLKSQLIGLAGEHPHGVKDLDSVIALALEENGVAELGERKLAIVTHMPLMGVMVHGIDNGPVPNGSIVPYEPNTWSSEIYQPGSIDAILTADHFNQQ